MWSVTPVQSTTACLSSLLNVFHRPILGSFMNRLLCLWEASSTRNLIQPFSKNMLPFRRYENGGPNAPPSPRKQNLRLTGRL